MVEVGLRVCRGWAFNSALILIDILLFLWIQLFWWTQFPLPLLELVKLTISSILFYGFFISHHLVVLA